MGSQELQPLRDRGPGIEEEFCLDKPPDAIDVGLFACQNVLWDVRPFANCPVEWLKSLKILLQRVLSSSSTLYNLAAIR